MKVSKGFILNLQNKNFPEFLEYILKNYSQAYYENRLVSDETLDKLTREQKILHKLVETLKGPRDDYMALAYSFIIIKGDIKQKYVNLSRALLIILNITKYLDIKTDNQSELYSLLGIYLKNKNKSVETKALNSCIYLYKLLSKCVDEDQNENINYLKKEAIIFKKIEQWTFATQSFSECLELYFLLQRIVFNNTGGFSFSLSSSDIGFLTKLSKIRGWLRKYSSWDTYEAINTFSKLEDITSGLDRNNELSRQVREKIIFLFLREKHKAKSIPLIRRKIHLEIDQFAEKIGFYGRESKRVKEIKEKDNRTLNNDEKDLLRRVKPSMIEDTIRDFRNNKISADGNFLETR